MDLQSRGLFYFFSVQAWAAWRLDFVSLIILGMSAFMVPAMHGKVEAGLTGLSLVYANSIVGIFQACTRMGAEILARFTSIERITEYISEVPAEVGPKEIAQEVPPPATWPSNGAIDFEDVTVSYRDGLPPVLQNLSLAIKAGEKVGIVGRTGSGKSSLMLCLFRLLGKLTTGVIKIDDIDISKISLDALRSKLAIIPQDPVMFAGTVRYVSNTPSTSFLVNLRTLSVASYLCHFMLTCVLLIPMTHH